MNFESLKFGFLSYLEEKIGLKPQITDKEEDVSNIEKENPKTNTDISIFQYSNEFKNYLVDEIGADVSIFSKSLDDIMSMDFVNGKFVENSKGNEIGDTFTLEGEDTSSSFMTEVLNDAFTNENVINYLDSDKSGDLNQEEMFSFLEGIAESSENKDEVSFDAFSKAITDLEQTNATDSIDKVEENTEEENKETQLTKMLDEMYKDPKVKLALDENKDGKISDKEKEKFEEFIIGYNGDGNKELSEADIKKAYEDILSGKFSYDDKGGSEIKQETTPQIRENPQNREVSQPTPQQNVQPRSGGGGGGFTPPSTSSSDKPVSEKSFDRMSLSELQTEKNTQQTNVTNAQNEINAVHSGENEQVKGAIESCEEAKEAYDEAVENDENIDEATKKERTDNLEAISKQEKVISDLDININNKKGEIKEKESSISSTESTLSSLESALSSLEGQTSDDPDKQAEINSKKEEVKKKIETTKKELEDQKSELETLKKDLTELEEQKTTEQETLNDLNKQKEEIEAKIQENCAPETKEAMEAYNKAKANVEEVKASELEKSQGNLKTAQANLDKVNEAIRTKEAEKTEKDYSVSEFNFDFELTLSDSQAGALDMFKDNWEKNKDKYEEVEKATGMPAELVAAIHWRESGGNFDTYLHNGQPLGQTTTLVPAGIYFEDWTDAAIDAVTKYGGGVESIDPDNIDTYYNYAEHYNGMGYHNKGLPSPYVWAGTSNYQSGKYVADGVFDPNHVDQQLGVAVMLQSIMA